jgi:type IX secretion system PorP/SprF family membrane protein
MPDFQIGLMLYSDNMFFGYSGNYLFRNKLFALGEDDKIIARQKLHHYGFAGYRMEFGNDWAFIPSLMLKYVQGAPAGIETNFRFNYASKAWFGAAFRPQDAVSGFVGFHLNNKLNLAYSYDYNISELNTFNSGSHEIILGIRFVRTGEKLYKPGMW